MGGSVEKQIQKALGSLPPCGNRCRFSESAICSSWVHPPSEIKSNYKFKALRWRPLRWRLTLSEESTVASEIYKELIPTDLKSSYESVSQHKAIHHQILYLCNGGSLNSACRGVQYRRGKTVQQEFPICVCICVYKIILPRIIWICLHLFLIALYPPEVDPPRVWKNRRCVSCELRTVKGFPKWGGCVSFVFLRFCLRACWYFSLSRTKSGWAEEWQIKGIPEIGSPRHCVKRANPETPLLTSPGYHSLLHRDMLPCLNRNTLGDITVSSWPLCRLLRE